eukprot:204552-Chlamydomonas_euryale.AAC.2
MPVAHRVRCETERAVWKRPAIGPFGPGAFVRARRCGEGGQLCARVVRPATWPHGTTVAQPTHPRPPNIEARLRQRRDAPPAFDSRPRRKPTCVTNWIPGNAEISAVAAKYGALRGGIARGAVVVARTRVLGRRVGPSGGGGFFGMGGLVVDFRVWLRSRATRRRRHDGASALPPCPDAVGERSRAGPREARNERGGARTESSGHTDARREGPGSGRHTSPAVRAQARRALVVRWGRAAAGHRHTSTPNSARSATGRAPPAAACGALGTTSAVGMRALYGRLRELSVSVLADDLLPWLTTSSPGPSPHVADHLIPESAGPERVDAG